MDTNLLVNNGSETGLALNDGVRNTHLLAKSGKEDHQFNGVNVVGDKNQRSLLVFDQTNNVVKTVLHYIRLLANKRSLILAVLDSRSFLDQTLLLLGFGLRAVLVEKTQSLSSKVLVENILELGDGRWDLETEVQDLLTALEENILRPFHHTRKVPTGLDILANTEVARTLLNERVLSR